MNGYNQLAVVLKALGHPVRLQILEMLRQEGEACVCHLEAHLHQRQAAISQHLARLRDAGLVIDRRDGMNVFYVLADGSLGQLLDAAKEAVATLPANETQSLSFHLPEARSGSGCCPCPRCQKQAVIC